MKRWEILHRAGWGLFALGVAAPAWPQTSPIPKGTITAKLTASGTLSANDGTPQDLVSAPGDAGRAFVAGRNGTIRILNNGALSSTPFLTLSAAGVSVYTGGEGGLLGLAFSPNFATDRKFYTLETEPFSNRTIAVKAAPAAIGLGDLERVIYEILEIAEQELRKVSLDDLRRGIAASLACRAAIKINTRLDQNKMNWLITSLAATEYPMSCPHGRPIALHYPTRDILKAFHRI